MNMFNSVELRKPQRSTFDLSHDKRLSAQMGYLYPVLIQECLPSDSFNGGTDMLVRMAPMIAPIFEQVQVYIHYFFVPNRLLWLEWEAFITGGQFGPDAQADPGPAPLPPDVNVEDLLAIDPLYFAKSKLYDYLGVPLLNDLAGPVSWSNAHLDCMPAAAYHKIWYDYYRDRRFVDDAIFQADELPLDSGTLNATDWLTNGMGSLRSRCYAHDYFMSANITAQLGDNAMTC